MNDMPHNPLRDLRKILNKKYTADVQIGKYRKNAVTFRIYIKNNEKGKVVVSKLKAYATVLDYKNDYFLLVFNTDILETLIGYCRII